MQGSQATANASPAMIGPPVWARRISSSGRHSRFSCGTNSVAMNSTPSSAITTPGDLAQQRAVVLERLAEAGGRHAERHEHRGEREAEEQRRAEHLARGPRPSWMSANETPEMVDR